VGVSAKPCRGLVGLKLFFNLKHFLGLRRLALFIHPLTGSRAFIWRAVAFIYARSGVAVVCDPHRKPLQGFALTPQ